MIVQPEDYDFVCCDTVESMSIDVTRNVTCMFQIREACKDLVLSDDQLKLVMQRLTEEINRGLSKATNAESIVKCFTTYVQDLPNGTGKIPITIKQKVRTHRG